MIIVECGPIEIIDGMKIRYSQPVKCPECDNDIGMWRYGYRKRFYKDFRAGKHYVMIPRYYCQKCLKVYWTLPDFLIPYKQYDRETIEKVQNGCWDGCGASYLSIYFWKKSIQT